ncbi:MAG: hypothetical protein JRF38_13810 [Deltaproteobacteria bacterium]|nr:hypothetical protein [Deltaproteobacteria bacterium]
MGFAVLGGPGLQSKIKGFEPEILNALNEAANKVKNGQASTECQRWFGDASSGFASRLEKVLRQFCSIINTQKISVNFASLKDRDRYENAAAYSPKSGWDEYINMTKVQGQELTMHINEAFARLPIYCNPDPATTVGQSQFETVVHELSHLILNTDDIVHNGNTAYGATAARNLAAADANNAKKNAENWGLFVEEFKL